ncbi:MAG: family 78 glycoside hydrolase catalytic domain [Kiritimatiellae bacterium]|nr:family 78 glycoside hydrolase catalytic domain [Kiritimatiellia bacterium]
MKANHLTAPVGCNLDNLSLSWIVASCDAPAARYARVEIALDRAFKRPVYDSGKRTDLDSLSFRPGLALIPRTRYFWRVSVTAVNGATAAGVSTFETGKINEPWTAAWITAPFGDGSDHFIVRKSFTLDRVPDTRAICAALGIFEIEVNGRSPTDEVLLPGYHSYTRQIQAQTFDITPLLRPGENTIAFHVGWGWYRSSMGWGASGPFGSTIGVRCEVRGRQRGADTLIAATDATWLCAPSPVLKSSIYYGEDYDARREVAGWSTPGCAAGNWKPAREFTPEGGAAGPIGDRFSPPIRIQETLVPEVIKTPAGETVLDFKQNLTGWVETVNRAPAGHTWRFQVGEILQQGNFYRDNLRSAEAQYTYTSNGSVGAVRPHFTFYGFRYVKLEGFPETVDPADFKARVIHSDLDRTGWLETSNPKVNRLFLNALWGQKGNFLDVPTDCPQRDERLGWTGDAQVFCGTACFNMDCAAFYSKYLNDMILEQAVFDGGVPHTVPALMAWIAKRDNHSACAWADAATVIPWTLHTCYGDAAMLRRQYPAMQAWVGRLKRLDDENGGHGLWNTGFHFADWLALDNYRDPKTCIGATDPYFIATAYYARSVEFTMKAAAALGESKDAVAYAKLLKKIKAAFLAEYFTAAGRCAVDTQTAHALALHFELVPASFRPRLVSTLVKKIKDNGNALATGFVGTPILCRVLSDNGHSELAHELLLREKYPSWLYEVNLGATTIWERWNSLLDDGTCSDTTMNSMNHYAYGSIVEWMYRNLAGLRPLEATPGFRHVSISPDAPRSFDFVKLRYASPVGEYRVEWKLTGRRYRLACTVPFGATAEVVLPAAPAKVKLNGKLVSSTRIKLRTGSHTFTYLLT